MSTTWLTAAELASMGLPDWPGSEFRSRARLQQLAIPSRIREGSKGGGGREYDTAALPAAVRRALLQHQVRTAPDALPAEPAPTLPAQPTTTAVAAPQPQPQRTPPTRAEAACADARTLLVQRLLDLAEVDGMTRATEALSRQLTAGDAPADLLQVAAAGNQRPRNADGGVSISARTLFRWVGEHRKGGWHALLPAPAQSRPLATIDDDVAAVLKRYASTSGAARNLTQVARDTQRAATGSVEGWKNLYERARRALPKLDQVKLIKARHTGAERDARLPYQRRLKDGLKPLDIAVMDGHTFKAKVRHPDHGQPFAPEVTVLLDVATRKVCGFSVSYSENVIAVGDCIRVASTTHGVWAIYYTDNGPGQKNKQLDCPIAGRIARLGAEHKLGRPGKPQGHGVIERSWRTHMLRCARQFGSYQGADADSGRVRSLRLEIAREQTAIKRSAATGDVVRLTPKVPTWGQFIDAVRTEIDRYNTEHRHRELPKHTEGPLAGQHMTPAEAWDAWLDPAEQMLLDGPNSRLLHMPAKLATAQRGWVRLNNAHYFSHELMQVDGQQVRVDFDIHDASAVWVWTKDGSFICEARAEGNSADFFPKPVLLQAKERRAARRVKLREQQAELARAELLGTLPAPRAEWQVPGLHTPAQSPEPMSPLPLVQRVDEAAAAPAAPADPHGRPACFDSAADRYEWLMQHRAAWQAEDAAWAATYAAGPEYRALHDYYASRGIGWPDEDPGEGFKTAG